MNTKWRFIRHIVINFSDGSYITAKPLTEKYTRKKPGKHKEHSATIRQGKCWYKMQHRYCERQRQQRLALLCFNDYLQRYILLMRHLLKVYKIKVFIQKNLNPFLLLNAFYLWGLCVTTAWLFYIFLGFFLTDHIHILFSLDNILVNLVRMWLRQNLLKRAYSTIANRPHEHD